MHAASNRLRSWMDLGWQNYAKTERLIWVSVYFSGSGVKFQSCRWLQKSSTDRFSVHCTVNFMVWRA